MEKNNMGLGIACWTTVMTTPDDAKDWNHRAVVVSAERAVGGLAVVTRNDQDIITVIHYKLLERDKFFFSRVFFISSVGFFFIQFYDEIYM